jgi:hypothetical protein
MYACVNKSVLIISKIAPLNIIMWVSQITQSIYYNHSHCPMAIVPTTSQQFSALHADFPPQYR